MEGGKFLEGLRVPEPRHCSFSSSEWLVRVFGPVIEPTSTFLSLQDANRLHRGAVRSEPVRHDGVRLAVALHRPFKKLYGGLLISPFRGEYFEYLAFVIHGAPEVMCLAIDPNEYLVQVPSPLRI